MALSDTVNRLATLLSGLSSDLAKVSKGNKSAAQRVRVGTIRLTKIGKQFRKESVASEKKPKRKAKRKKR